MKRLPRARLDEMAIIENTRAVLRTIAANYGNAYCGRCRTIAGDCGLLADALTQLLKGRGPERTTIDPGDALPWDL